MPSSSSGSECGCWVGWLVTAQGSRFKGLPSLILWFQYTLLAGRAQGHVPSPSPSLLPLSLPSPPLPSPWGRSLVRGGGGEGRAAPPLGLWPSAPVSQDRLGRAAVTSRPRPRPLGTTQCPRSWDLLAASRWVTGKSMAESRLAHVCLFHSHVIGQSQSTATCGVLRGGDGGPPEARGAQPSAPATPCHLGSLPPAR